MATSQWRRCSIFDVSFPGEAALLSVQEWASTSISAQSAASVWPVSSNGIPQKRRSDATNYNRVRTCSIRS